MTISTNQSLGLFSPTLLWWLFVIFSGKCICYFWPMRTIWCITPKKSIINLWPQQKILLPWGRGEMTSLGSRKIVFIFWQKKGEFTYLALVHSCKTLFHLHFTMEDCGNRFNNFTKLKCYMIADIRHEICLLTFSLLNLGFFPQSQEVVSNPSSIHFNNHSCSPAHLSL